MKRVQFLVCVCIALLLGVRVWQESAVTARAGARVVFSSENGDCNGDNRRNVSDAIYLLQWLFSRGPEPAALAQEAGELTPEQQEVLSHFRVIEIEDGQGARLKTIQFHDANLQVVNGLGATNTQNGLGNLIVGYQETRPGTEAMNVRTGSHNLVV